MAARAIWQGHLRLSLVSLPVQLYSATDSSGTIPLNQIHAPSGERIRYQKIAPGVGPVDADDIIRGFQVEKGRYVLLEDEELESLKIEAKKTIELVQFVDQGDISPLYYERPYYLSPDGELAEEAYVVIRDALKKTGKVAIGQLVMRGKDNIVAIRPCGQGLLLETLRYADEVREAERYFEGLDDVDPPKDALDLATELIGRKEGPFRPEEFHDRYTEALRDLIEAKQKNMEPLEIDSEDSDAGGKVIDLMDALKKSVAQNKKSGGAKKKTASKSSSSKTKKSA